MLRGEQLAPDGGGGGDTGGGGGGGGGCCTRTGTNVSAQTGRAEYYMGSRAAARLCTGLEKQALEVRPGSGSKRSTRLGSSKHHWCR